MQTGTYRTALITDESFFWQSSFVDFGPWIEGRLVIEGPEPRRRLLNLIRRSGLIKHLRAVTPMPLGEHELALVHSREYISRIKALSDGEGGEAGEFAAFGPGTYEIAALAAGAAATAIIETSSGRSQNAYALVRPPGHHAERDRGRGYCIFSNVALGIRVAQQAGHIHRAAVVDLDVHHGNGTEQAFLDDPSVLAISIHQDRSYPEDSGLAEQTGTGAGRGTTINIPLPPGSGLGAYRAAMAEIVRPAIDSFRPDVIVIAAGYDAGGLDPLGRMLLSAAAYGELTGFLMELAERLCHGRIVAVQEGGYSALHVPFCGLRVIEALSGVTTAVDDPFSWLDSMPGQDLTSDQRSALDAIREDLIAGEVAFSNDGSR